MVDHSYSKKSDPPPFTSRNEVAFDHHKEFLNNLIAHLIIAKQVYGTQINITNVLTTIEQMETEFGSQLYSNCRRYRSFTPPTKCKSQK